MVNSIPRLEVAVTDTGIPADLFDTTFDEFQRLGAEVLCTGLGSGELDRERLLTHMGNVSKPIH